ncbi:MAG: 3-hydroxybutyryl-CoA dehydrogenase [Thermoleophilaceae bacterium]|jgi:3-hydroxybutyryl-CoA dehydrogenase|nr:3-hydroxybutyryl-CoA dehydrogenase [Thermoleophilaceae bacterium]
MTVSPERLGVVGAGTMGAGIAQLGVLASMDTVLYDAFPEALERGRAKVEDGLRKGAERGRWTAEEAEAAGARLRTSSALEDLADRELIIEAAPERPDLKRELFGQLSAACSDDVVLATNTSSILVTSLASAAARPENVVGMHFFNPPPLMKLVEIIAAEQTGERAIELATGAAEAMGKRAIVAQDGPGFLVNRCNRPFGAEALRMLQEGMATVEQIDRIYRLGGGFRMGPFELMDLVGIDVGFEVAKSFMAQSFGEPRWKPSPLQEKMVAAGRLGRKSGRGWYDYSGDSRHRPDDPDPLEPGGGDGRRVAIDGSGPLARELRQRAVRAGFDAREPDGFGGLEEPELIVDAAVPAPASDLGIDTPGGPPLLVLCADQPLYVRGNPAAVGFHVLPPLDESRLVELTGPRGDAGTAAERFFAALGFHHEWVQDAPGLVLGRVVCQLVNEAAFAVGEGVGSAADVDEGLKLGMNHPRGPVEWSGAIGLDHVVATLDALHEERYRVAPLLLRGAIE